MDGVRLVDLQQFFYSHFIPALAAESRKDPQQFALRFNNDLSKKRVRNCRPRTDLMADGTSGVLPTLLRALWPPHDTRLEHSYTRYGDIMVYESDWYSGKRTNLVVVEVENELDEFKGTISDLLRNQGRYKIGVFYQEDRDFESRAAEIREIFGHFAGCGFREAADTRYLIVFGPTAISEAGGIGAWCASVLKRISKTF